MIRLGLPKQNFDLALPHGVMVTVRAPTTAIMAAARAASMIGVGQVLDEIAARKNVGAALDGLPDLDDDATRQGLAQALHIKGVARAAIVKWSGVMKAEGDEPAPLTQAAIDELMDIPGIGESFLDKYLAPLDALAAEGNASGPAPNGTTATGPLTAPDAATAEVPAREGSAA